MWNLSLYMYASKSCNCPHVKWFLKMVLLLSNAKFCGILIINGTFHYFTLVVFIYVRPKQQYSNQNEILILYTRCHQNAPFDMKF